MIFTGSHGVVLPSDLPRSDRKMAMKTNGSVVSNPIKKLFRCNSSKMSSRRMKANASAKPTKAINGINEEVEVKIRLSVQYCGALVSAGVPVCNEKFGSPNKDFFFSAS